MAENEENLADAAYKWTVRSLYVAAIGLNLWYMAETYKGSPEGEAMKAKAAKVFNALRHPYTEAKKFRRMANETVVEAWVIVDEANKGDVENEE